MKSNFNILPMNKSEIFSCSIEGMNTLTRTGTITTNNNEESILLSFYNSVLLACSHKFRTETVEERKNAIIEFAKIMSKRYKNGSKSLNQLNIFFARFHTSIKKFANFLVHDDNSIDEYFEELIYSLLINEDSNKNNTAYNIELYKIIFKIISPSVGFEKIINFAKKRWLEQETYNSSLDDLAKLIMKETIRFFKYQDISDKIDDDKQEVIKNKIISLINGVFNFIIHDENDEEIQYLLPKKLDVELLNLVSRHFKTRIFFIDYLNKEPFKFENYEIHVNIKSVFLLSFNHIHYEIIGKKLNNEFIQREFLPTDDIVKFTLCHLEELPFKIHKPNFINDSTTPLVNFTPNVKLIKEENLPNIEKDSEKPDNIKTTLIGECDIDETKHKNDEFVPDIIADIDENIVNSNIPDQEKTEILRLENIKDLILYEEKEK